MKRRGKRGSGISVLIVRYDDDDVSSLTHTTSFAVMTVTVKTHTNRGEQVFQSTCVPKKIHHSNNKVIFQATTA